MTKTDNPSAPNGFDFIAFLDDHFGDVNGVVGLVHKHLPDAPRHEAVRKWFARGSVSSEWFPMLLAVLEKENGCPVALTPYVQPGDRHDIFT